MCYISIFRHPTAPSRKMPSASRDRPRDERSEFYEAPSRKMPSASRDRPRDERSEFYEAPSSSLVRTSASQAENTGSNPVGAILLRPDAFARGFVGIDSFEAPKRKFWREEE